MGLKTAENENRTYLNIIGGKLAVRLKSHIEENGKVVTEEREIRDKATGEVLKTVIERYYQSLEGLITEAYIDPTGDYGSRIVIKMLDEGEEFIIQLPVESNYGRSFMLRVPNIDTSMPTTIRPYSFEDDNGKIQSGVTVYQSDRGFENDKVPAKWTKDNPGELPPWEGVDVGGKMKWNSDKQTNFLIGELNKWANQLSFDHELPVEEPTEEPIEDKSEDLKTVSESADQAVDEVSQAAAEAFDAPEPKNDLPFE